MAFRNQGGSEAEQHSEWGVLCWRGTFIDVEQHKEEGVYPLCRAMREPAVRRNRDEHSDAFGKEIAYVNDLSGKFAGMWRSAVQRRSTASTCSQTPSCTIFAAQANSHRSLTAGSPCTSISSLSRGPDAGTPKMTTKPPRAALKEEVHADELKRRTDARTEQLCELLQSYVNRPPLVAVKKAPAEVKRGAWTPSSSESMGERSSWVVRNQAVADQGFASQVDANHAIAQGRSSRYGDTRGSGVSSPMSCVSADDAGEPSGAPGCSQTSGGCQGCNPGSSGHPELCSRPCTYYAAGSCTNGVSCDFCHLPHPKRSVHMDRRYREILREMPLQQSAALVLPLLRRKLVAFDRSAETATMFAELAAACGIADTASSDDAALPVEFRDRKRLVLVTTLKAMSLRLLLMTVSRSMGRGQPQVGALADRLMQRLRAAAPPTRASPDEAFV